MTNQINDNGIYIILVDDENRIHDMIKETFETFVVRAEQVIDQTVRRVFQDEQVPASEKIVSNFDPHRHYSPG